jgi:hypothetical protein
MQAATKKLTPYAFLTFRVALSAVGLAIFCFAKGRFTSLPVRKLGSVAFFSIVDLIFAKVYQQQLALNSAVFAPALSNCSIGSKFKPHPKHRIPAVVFLCGHQRGFSGNIGDMHRNTACSHLVLLGGHTTGMLYVRCRYLLISKPRM